MCDYINNNEYSIGNRVKCKIYLGGSKVEWVYGTIKDITPYEEGVNEYNYEVEFDNGKTDYLSCEDIAHVFGRESLNDEMKIMWDSISDKFDINKMFSNNEDIVKFKEVLRESLMKTYDYRDIKPMEVNPCGTNDVLKVNQIEISGDSQGSDNWYRCENGKLYQDLTVEEVYVPDNIKKFIKQVENIDTLDLDYEFMYKIKL